MIKHLENEQEFNELIKGRILVDFYADWCGPCKMLSPNIDEISNLIKVIKVNVDLHEDLSREYGVMSIPCLVLLENKKEIKRNIGYLSVDDLKSFINQ